MEFIGPSPQFDLTYSDVFLVPGRSSVRSRFEVDLSSDDGAGLSVPVVAANMNSVTGPRMAVAMAQRGGLAVLPQDLPLDDALEAVTWTKRQDPLAIVPAELAATATVADALRIVPPVEGATLLLRDNDGEPIGVLAASELSGHAADAVVGDVFSAARQARGVAQLEASALTDARAAFDALVAHDAQLGEVLRDGRIIGAVTRDSAVRASIAPPAVDAEGRLRVAAAIGISGDAAGRALALAEAGADVLVLDTAHGHQERMRDAIAEVRAAGVTLPLVAGNVVTAAGVRDLVEAGASIVKVGVGPGAMCTTRMMTAVGRPQFSAVLECAAEAASLGASVWADGGVRAPRDVALALAAGASAVMIGSWFAGTIESPGEVRLDDDGSWFKESFGMASTRAVHGRFGALDPFELARKAMFAEGISSSRIRIDPTRPAVADLVDLIDAGVRSACSYAGAASLGEFRSLARVGIQSTAGYDEGKPLAASWESW